MPSAWLKNNFILILILIFSLFLYSFRLNTIPPSLYADEATEGYSAYSIWHTGQDEYGRSFPLLFRLFGAYTPPLYIYLSAPIVGIFGMTIFNIRFLSVISGIISVFIFYKIVSFYIKQKHIRLVSTFFYAILPWTIFNSRLGYEVMLAATLFNLGVYFLLTQKHDFLGFLFISLSTYTAHTQKFLAPIFLLAYLIYSKKLTFKNIVFLIFTQLPNIYLMTTPAFWVKSGGLSGHSVLEIAKSFITQIVTYLSPYTLFFQIQDIDLQHQIPQIGLFFWWMIIPLVIGLKKAPKFLIFWLVISLIPASLSGGFISVQRALPMLFPIMIIISIGLKSINSKILIILGIYSLLLAHRSYFVLLPKEMTLAWNYGYSQLSDFVSSHPESKFIIDNTRNNGSYSIMLYNLKYSPQKYHLEVDPYFRQNYYQAPSAPTRYQFANLTFHPLDWQTDACQYDYVVGDSLSISQSQQSEHGLTLVDTFITPTNEIALKIYKTSKDGTLCP